MEKKNIIALLGMPGSGKSAAIEYLMAVYHLPKVYFGKVTFDEIKRRGLPINAANERFVREELRLKFGKEHYANEVMRMIHDNQDAEHILVESLYSWTEFQVMKRNFGERLHTITIHASPKLRHERLGTRAVRPLTKDEAEIRDIGQIEQLEQGGPIALSDYVVVNETGITDMNVSLDHIMETLGITKA